MSQAVQRMRTCSVGTKHWVSTSISEKQFFFISAVLRTGEYFIEIEHYVKLRKHGGPAARATLVVDFSPRAYAL